MSLKYEPASEPLHVSVKGPTAAVSIELGIYKTVNARF